MSTPKKGKSSLSFAMGLPPKDAIAYFESKGYAVTFDWRSVWQDSQAKAFTVSSVAKLDILEDIRGALDSALKDGKTEAWFSRQLTPILQEKGWWGKRIDVGPDGGAQVVKMGSPARLKLIYRQNMQTSYMAGRYKQMLENADNRPWWTFVALLDENTTSGCRSLNFLTFRYDDPFWDSHYPPNHLFCRSRVRARSDRDLAREKISPFSGEGNMVTEPYEYADKRTGEVTSKTVTGWRAPGGQVFRTEPGFSYNPGRAAFGSDMETARKLSLVQDTGLRGQVIQALNNAPLRHTQFAKQVDAVLDTRRASKQSLAVGFVEPDIAAFARGKGHEPGTIIVMPEKQLLHADRPKHHDAGIALSREQFKALPLMIASPERVLWNVEKGGLVYVYPDDKDTTRKITIRVETPVQKKRGKDLGAPDLDAVITAFSVPAQLFDDVKKFIRIK